MGNRIMKKKTFAEIDEHTLSVQEVCNRFSTDLTQGLSSVRVKKLLAKNGPNKLSPRKFRVAKRDDPTKSVGTIKEDNNGVFPETATVVRDGETQTIACQGVVVGDIVLIKAGDTVPADLRIVSSHGCKVDRSELNGEAEAQPLSPEVTNEEDIAITSNLALVPFKIAQGSAKGIVIRVGDGTFYGHHVLTSLTPNSS